MFDRLGYASFQFGETRISVGTPGRPAALAALAALTVAGTFDIPPAGCSDPIAQWRGVHGRTEVLDLGRILLMDDSYNANPMSMQAALEDAGAA